VFSKFVSASAHISMGDTTVSSICIGLVMLVFMFVSVPAALKPKGLLVQFYGAEQAESILGSAVALWPLTVHMMRIFACAMIAHVIWISKVTFFDSDVQTGIYHTATIIGLFYIPILYRAFLEPPSSPDWSSVSRDGVLKALKMFGACGIILCVAYLFSP